eukprot:Selendium_serpulae@DN6069_c0_g1_i10.p1
MVKRSGQTFLDCGQRSFDYVTCRDCRFVYAPGVAEDHKLHKNYHAAYKRRITRHKLTQRQPSITPTSAWRVFKSLTPQIAVREDNEAFHLAVASCPAKITPVLSKLFSTEINETSSHLPTTMYFLVDGTVKDDTSFAAIMWVSHNVQVYKLRFEGADTFDAHSFVVETAPQKDKDTIGINYLWVRNADERRSCIRRLVKMAFGSLTGSRAIAFKAPTDKESLQLALSVLENNDCWFLVHY